MERLEKLAFSIFKEMEKDGEPVTMEEAREMAKMEINSKELCRRYEKSDKPRTTIRERKVDANKKAILDKIYICLEEAGIAIDNVQNETTISFHYKKDSYSLKLVKHRKKKS